MASDVQYSRLAFGSTRTFNCPEQANVPFEDPNECTDNPDFRYSERSCSGGRCWNTDRNCDYYRDYDVDPPCDSNGLYPGQTGPPGYNTPMNSINGCPVLCRSCPPLLTDATCTSPISDPDADSASQCFIPDGSDLTDDLWVDKPIDIISDGEISLLYPYMDLVPTQTFWVNPILGNRTWPEHPHDAIKKCNERSQWIDQEKGYFLNEHGIAVKCAPGFDIVIDGTGNPTGCVTQPATCGNNAVYDPADNQRCVPAPGYYLNPPGATDTDANQCTPISGISDINNITCTNSNDSTIISPLTVTCDTSTHQVTPIEIVGSRYICQISCPLESTSNMPDSGIPTYEQATTCAGMCFDIKTTGAMVDCPNNNFLVDSTDPNSITCTGDDNFTCLYDDIRYYIITIII